jgi:hypothetical protein
MAVSCSREAMQTAFAASAKCITSRPRSDLGPAKSDSLLAPAFLLTVSAVPAKQSFVFRLLDFFQMS